MEQSTFERSLAAAGSTPLMYRRLSTCVPDRKFTSQRSDSRSNFPGRRGKTCAEPQFFSIETLCCQLEVSKIPLHSAQSAVAE